MKLGDLSRWLSQVVVDGPLEVVFDHLAPARVRLDVMSLDDVSFSIVCGDELAHVAGRLSAGEVHTLDFVSEGPLRVILDGERGQLISIRRYDDRPLVISESESLTTYDPSQGQVSEAERMQFIMELNQRRFMSKLESMYEAQLRKMQKGAGNGETSKEPGNPDGEEGDETADESAPEGEKGDEKGQA